MQQWQKNVYLLWAAVLVASISWSMVFPFMPVFLEEELGVAVGASAWTGVMGAVGSLGTALSAPVWGAMGDRYGRKIMMMRAGVVLTLGYLLMSIVTGPYQLLGVRLMIGLLTGFIPTATALVGTTTPQEHVGAALSVVTTAGPTGTILGPMLGGLLADLMGIRPTMLVSAVCIGSVTLLVFILVREQFKPVERKPGVSLLTDLGEVLQHKTFARLMVTTILAMAAMSTLDPVMVPYIKSLLGQGAPNWLAGVLYSLPGAAFVVAAPLWAARARRWGFGTTLSLGVALGAAFILPQAFAFTVWDFGGLRLAQGLATAAVSPGIAALITEVLPEPLRGRGFGINQSATSVGFMTGPLIGGFVGTAVGARWVFAVAGVLFLAAAIWTRLGVAPRLKAADRAV